MGVAIREAAVAGRLWLVGQARRHDAHSLYLVFAALLLASTLVIDLTVRANAAPPWLSAALIAVCLIAVITAFVRGRRIPKWIGIVSVLIFTAAQAYFLSRPDDPDSVLAAVQQLPIAAFYLGWFVSPRPALLMIGICFAVFAAAMLTNPLLAQSGRIGVPVAVHGLLVLLFCFSIGNYLWRRNMRRATTDPLTSARNREGLMDRLRVALRGRRGVPFTLVVIDFDDFKGLNDTRGHAAGDRALVDSVHAWRRHTRSRDVVARIGGDEFALLLHSATYADAEVIMGRLHSLAEHSWSWGAAEATAGDSPDSVLGRADLALYAQKQRRAAGERRG